MKKLFPLLLWLVLCSTTTFATTYYISPTGNDATGNGTLAKPWKTLYKATQTVVSPGDIIHVVAGTFTETQQCNLRAGVSIEGEGIDVSIIKSGITGQWSTFLALSSPQGTNGAQTITNLTLDGQYVSETTNKTWWGILVQGRSNVVINYTKIINFRDRGVIFDGNDVTDPVTDPGNYATGNKFHNNTLLNCAAQNNNYGSGCINIGGQLGMEVYNNTIVQDQRAKAKNGWPIKYWDNGWNKGLKIYNNTLTKKNYEGTYPGDMAMWDFAVELFNNFGLEFYNNIVQGSLDLNYNRKGTYAFCAWIHHNTFNHSTLNANFESGIILEFRTESVLIEYNTFNNVCNLVQFNTRTVNQNGGYPNPGGGTPAGGFSQLKDNVIRNNLATNIYQGNGIGTAAGVTVISESGNDPQISNLDIYNNTIIAKSGDAPYICFDFTSGENGAASGVNIRNNIVQGFTDSWLRGSNGNTAMSTVVVTHNNVTGNGNGNDPLWPAGNPSSYTYSNKLSVNPLFVGGTNYTLQPSSPMRDAGVNVGLPYSGSAPDIGYAEYGGAVPPPENVLPTANAGPDKTITLPTNSTTATGSGTDSDGTIAGYLWTIISGSGGSLINATTTTVTASSLTAGVYQLELRVTDNSGGVKRDTMSITVLDATQNVVPFVNAGGDQTITIVVRLSGKAVDVDGTISSYAWTKVSGPAGGTITTPSAAATTVTGLGPGTYVYRLTATDNNGATVTSDVTIVIN